jgi:hypothetical protein
VFREQQAKSLQYREDRIVVRHVWKIEVAQNNDCRVVGGLGTILAPRPATTAKVSSCLRWMFFAEASPKYRCTLARLNFAFLNRNEARKGIPIESIEGLRDPGQLDMPQRARLDGDLTDLLADFDPFLCVVEVHHAFVVAGGVLPPKQSA